MREYFNLDREKIFLDSMLISSHPKIVRDAIEKHRDAFDHQPAYYWTSHIEEMDRATHQAAAEYLSVREDEVAITTSATVGLGMLFSGLVLPPGSEILISDHDHFSALKPAEYAAERHGYELRKISWYEDTASFSPDLCVKNLLAQISEKTRVLLVTWVHSCTGVMLPLREIGQAIAALNIKRKEKILLFVDGVHAFGVEDFTMAELHCDAFTASCHKWLFGPRGTGFLWVRPGVEAYLKPLIASYNGAYYHNWRVRKDERPVAFAHTLSPGGFMNFESRWALKEAFAFHLQIGKKNIAEQTKALARYTLEGLETIPGLRMITPKNAHCSLVCFTPEHLNPQTLVRHLRKRGIFATTTPYFYVYARFSPAIYNTKDEIDTTLDAIKQILQRSGKAS